MHTITITTQAKQELVNISSQVQSLVSQQGWLTGAVLVYCPHTSAAVTINEGVDPALPLDLLAALDKTAPATAEYKHVGDNADAHIKASLIGPDVMVMVIKGQIQLGHWQSIFFCEFDGPREREVWIKWMG